MSRMATKRVARCGGLWLAAGILLGGVSVAAAATEAPAVEPHVPGELVIKLKADVVEAAWTGAEPVSAFARGTTLAALNRQTGVTAVTPVFPSAQPPPAASGVVAAQTAFARAAALDEAQPASGPTGPP